MILNDRVSSKLSVWGCVLVGFTAAVATPTLSLAQATPTYASIKHAAGISAAKDVLLLRRAEESADERFAPEFQTHEITFVVPQSVADKGRKISERKAVREVAFDAYGRRTVVISSRDGPFESLEGITKITPQQITVESLRSQNALVYKFAIPNKSVSRDVLGPIIYRTLDRGSIARRTEVVKFYLEAERLDDAFGELKEVLRNFPSQQGER